jgi:hypothetical protein
MSAGELDLNRYLLTILINVVVTGFLGILIYELRQMRKSVDELNIKIAVVIKEVEFHDARIVSLENKLNNC